MVRKKQLSVFKRMISFVAVLCMIFSMNVTVFATANALPAVAEAKQGVLQINLVYVDNSGNQYILQTGSGFLVGASTGATTVITNYHVISLTDEDKTTYTEVFGVDFFNANNINLQIKVVVQSDVVISASYVNGSVSADFAILELSQPIHNRVPLKIADSASVVQTQEVYALGFPAATTNLNNSQVYTSKDVTITGGIVGKSQEISGTNYILHDANLGAGNSGGPLVDLNGNVIGVNTMYTSDDSAKYFYSIAINDVSEVLDALGITYEKASGESSVVEPEPEPATEIEQESQSEQAVVEPEPLPSPEPDTQVGTNLVEGKNDSSINYVLIIGIAVAVVVVIAVIIIIVVVSGSKKKKTTPNVGIVSGGNSGYSGANNGGMPYSNMPQDRPTPPPFTPIAPGTMPMDSGAGETSVLGGGAGETSVLGGASMQPTAHLIRKKNGEQVSIVKPSFSIGKERAKVDFCIPDNNSISRIHANIVCRGGMYYLMDNNSTNFSFVNGNKVTPGQEVRLNSGDKIKLSDEEFDFRL